MKQKQSKLARVEHYLRLRNGQAEHVFLTETAPLQQLDMRAVVCDVAGQGDGGREDLQGQQNRLTGSKTY